jgi:prevent-host-death family protein
MQLINIHEAKTNLSRLVEMAAQGQPFVIAKAGRPMVKVVPYDGPDPAPRKRLGFLQGQFGVTARVKDIECESRQIAKIKKALIDADAGNFATPEELAALDKKWGYSAH